MCVKHKKDLIQHKRYFATLRIWITEVEKMGNRIARARVFRGLTQVELAARVGVSQAKVNSWEGGYHKVKPDILSEIAAALDVRPSWLAGGGGRMWYENAFCDVAQINRQDGAVIYTLDHPRLGMIEVRRFQEIA